MKGTFRSLENFDYRVWAGGAIVSKIGTWMQRTAQDWLALTQLTRHNATSVGVVMALQFGPHLLLLPFTGFAADHLDRRKLLIATQAALGTLALGLGILTVAGLVQVWHVYRLSVGSPILSARAGRSALPLRRVLRRRSSGPGIWRSIVSCACLSMPGGCGLVSTKAMLWCEAAAAGS